MSATQEPVVVVGAGPVGLAAAAHLLERGLRPLVLEAAAEPAASTRDWGHVRLFSPWRFSLDEAAVRRLEAAGWSSPPLDELPTGHELYREYLRPLAELPGMREHLRTDRRVVGITRRGGDKIRTAGRGELPFLVRTRSAAGAIEDFTARAVIDASGTWHNPNPIGATGLPAVGEAEHRTRIHYGIPDVLDRDRERYADRTTLVVGAGHSAAGSILALAELASLHGSTEIVWATRSEDLTRVLGGGAADGLPARGKLGADLRQLAETGRLELLRGFRIEAIEERDGRLHVSGQQRGRPFARGGIDSIIAATGQRPELDLARELRLALDPALECAAALGPMIDPNEHSCGTVRPHGARELAHPEPGFYIVGSKAYGRAPTFLLATGYEQVRSIAAMLAGDREAALRVELDLPETGVCRSDFTDADGGGCCTSERSACC